jgi:hypothetical protein
MSMALERLTPVQALDPDGAAPLTGVTAIGAGYWHSPLRFLISTCCGQTCKNSGKFRQSRRAARFLLAAVP